MAQALRFEWDPTKDSLNRRRHGVSFTEATSVFVDDHALLVCHCYRAEGGVVRLISARKADKQEQHEYFARFQS